MSKFIFENKETRRYRTISQEAKVIVHDALISDPNAVQCYYIDAGSWGDIKDNFGSLMFNSIYRVLAKPYTLEDALAEVVQDSCDANGFVNPSERVISVGEAEDIIRKLAVSMGGENE